MNVASQDAQRPRWAAQSALLTGVLVGSVLAAPAAFAQVAPATGTAAGTEIVNTATATYDTPGGGAPTQVTSPAAVIKVSELLVVDVVSTDGASVPTSPGATTTLLTFTVTNTGNGVERYDLSTVVPATPTSTVTGIFIDANGNGVIDPGEPAYVAGTGVELDPGEQVRVLVRVTTAPGAADASTQDVGLVAVSTTLAGGEAAGTVIAGAGDGGSDAVVGAGGARDRDDATLIVQAATLELLKSATVAGGGSPLPGATITYTITARAVGSGTVRGIVISDAVPDDTSYTAGSIRLGGTSLTDAADADRGRIVADTISVDVGNLANGASASVSFDVTID